MGKSADDATASDPAAGATDADAPATAPGSTDGAAGATVPAAPTAPTAPAAAPAEGPVAGKPARQERTRSVPVKETINKGRSIVARVVWLVCVLAALALAIGALLIVLDANRGNGLVRFVLDAADVADVGIFQRDNGIKTFTGADAETKNVLVNWGIGALAWLVVGRVVERVVRP